MTTFSSVLTETLRLLVRSGQLWVRLWPQLIGLMLLGWAGYYSALLAASEVGIRVPFLVVPVFALGLVALLASTVVALRMVASQLGVTAMVRAAERADAEEEEDDEPDGSLSRLLVITLLPFLGVYAAFGYVEEMTTQLVLVSSQRGGLEQNVLVQLNPTGNTTAMVITLAALVGLYVLRRLVDVGYQRTGWRGVGLFTAFIEACFLFLALLAGFRVVERVGLWLGERRFLSWWDAGMDNLAAGLAVFRIDLPEVVVRLGEFFSQVFWPVFWEGLTQPVAWLAMAALVFGSRVLSLADLWRKGQPLGSRLPGAQHLRITRRLQQSASEATGARRVLLQVQEAFFGDIDDKYLPTFQSLRLMLRAGTVFLGGYVIAFTGVQLVADGLQELVYTVVGGRQGGTWIALMPFLDLTSRVLAMSVQVTLLAVAFARVLTIFSGRADQRRPVAVPSGSAPQDPPGPAPQSASVGRRTQLAQAGVVLLCCALLAAGTVQFQQLNEFRRVSAVVGEPGPLMGREVVVEPPRLGQVLVQELASEETTELAFVVVGMAVSCQACPQGTTTMRLVSGEREYGAQFGSTNLLSEDGFRNQQEYAFEVDPADLDEDLHAEVRVTEFISGYADVLDVDLGLDEASAARARDELEGATVAFSPQAVRTGAR